MEVIVLLLWLLVFIHLCQFSPNWIKWKVSFHHQNFVKTISSLGWWFLFNYYLVNVSIRVSIQNSLYFLGSLTKNDYQKVEACTFIVLNIWGHTIRPCSYSLNRFLLCGLTEFMNLGVSGRATSISVLDTQIAKLEGASVCVCVCVCVWHHQNINYIRKSRELIVERVEILNLYSMESVSVERAETVYLSQMIHHLQWGA